MPAKAFGAAATAAALLLSACGGDVGVDAVKAAKNGAPRVVVAVLDSAINPYHEHFYAGSALYPAQAPSAVTPAVLAEIGVPPENIIELSRSGNIQKDKAADAAKWSKIRRGRPYWFKGTNIIGVTFASSSENRLIPMPEKNPHGVGCTAAVLAANPEAVVLFIETWDDYANDEAHLYAMQHPAVDILSSSYGFGAPPFNTPPLPLPIASTATYDGVLKLGKLHIQAAGNGPGFTPGNGGSGAWWSIGVSGFQDNSRGQEPLSSNYPDFVSDYTQDLPYCMDCERGFQSVGGTSFSTPRAAGVASRVLLEARRAVGHGGAIRLRDGRGIMVEGAGKTITNWDVRRALEEAAFSDYGVMDYSPDAAVPINDAAPWLQVAWGDLTAEPDKGVVAEALAQLGFGTPTRSKGPDYCEYQAANMRFRQSYWDAVAAQNGSGEVVPDPNPYLFCDSALP